MSEVLDIARLGAQGDGIAADGTYVPFALPGERVRVSRLGARGWPERVVDPSPARVAPPCPQFTRCGGCAMQHAADDLVAEWKRAALVSALAARGIEDVAIRAMVTAPAGTRRRIAVAAGRGKKGVRIGFHARGGTEIVPVAACPVAHPDLVAVLPRLEELALKGATRRAPVRITLTRSRAGIDAAVTEAKALDGPGTALLAGAAARAGLARLAWNGAVAVTFAAPVQVFGRARVVPPPGAFLQPTDEGEEALAAAVSEAVGDAARVADLFAGSGTFALRLAERSEVLAVEGEAEALAALDSGWRGCPGLHAVRGARRDLFARPLRPAEMAGLDALVLDPPRAGARGQAECLAEGGPARLAYVSCNPATFARDARILIDGGYALDWVQPVDQFRWSPHLELAAAFSRR